MKTYIATLETRHFTFDTAAATPTAAKASLLRILHAHEKQNNLGEGGKWFEEDDIVVRGYEFGIGYRDGARWP